jgi:hypothetical protein
MLYSYLNNSLWILLLEEDLNYFLIKMRKKRLIVGANYKQSPEEGEYVL